MSRANWNIYNLMKALRLEYLIKCIDDYCIEEDDDYIEETKDEDEDNAS